jgi:hypothetical protein
MVEEVLLGSRTRFAVDVDCLVGLDSVRDGLNMRLHSTENSWITIPCVD